MKHLKNHELNYFQHMLLAFTYAGKLALLSIIAIIHGIIPFMFETYVTDELKKLK